MLSNNKFLVKCWYGGQPWIRLAMESESMVEKRINFIFCLGTFYDISKHGKYWNVAVRHQMVQSLCISVIPGLVMLTHTILEDL